MGGSFLPLDLSPLWNVLVTIRREGGEKGGQVLGVQEAGGTQKRGLRAHPMETSGFGMDWNGQGGTHETLGLWPESVILPTMLGDLEGKAWGEGNLSSSAGPGGCQIGGGVWVWTRSQLHTAQKPFLALSSWRERGELQGRRHG